MTPWIEVEDGQRHALYMQRQGKIYDGSQFVPDADIDEAKMIGIYTVIT